MNLYVWNNPYRVKYGGSCLYVMAESVEQAREFAARSVPISCFGMNPRAKDQMDTMASQVKREPDRVIAGPAAECYHWEE